MIESGLALVAACLPTLRFLFGNILLHNTLFSSLGRVFSLQTLHAEHSYSTHHVRLNDDRHADSTALHIGFTSSNPSKAELYAMQDVEAQKEIPQRQI